jgi:hypothetical protein
MIGRVSRSTKGKTLELVSTGWYFAFVLSSDGEGAAFLGSEGLLKII